MKTFLIFIVQVCWNSSCSLTSCQDQVSLASPPVIRLFWKVICAGGRVCVLCHSPPRHTHTEKTLKDASKLSKCILSWCSWISLCVCILHAAILLYVCMWMFMCVCVCGLCKMRMFPLRWWMYRSLSKPRDLFPPPWTKCSRLPVRQQSLSKKSPDVFW